MHKFLETARQHALSHNYDESLEYHLCALIVSGGRILSVGFNKRNKNSFVRHYQKHVRDWCFATHAEQSAILNIRKKIDLRGSKIYVIRLMAENKLGLSRPCPMCQSVLFAYGISKMVYSVDENTYSVEKVVNTEINYHQ